MDALIQGLRDSLAGRKKIAVSEDGLKPAAVLVLLYEKAGEPHVLLTKRTSRVDDHKGEISFPGGAFHEGEDQSLLQTALRESMEEVGLIVEYADVLGEMDDTTTRSRYCISPYVATLKQPQEFVAFPVEVADILEVPLRTLLDPANRRDEPVNYAGRWVEGSYFQYGEHVIWGATASILREFLAIVERQSS